MLLAPVTATAAPGADLVLRGGRIYTLDTAHPWASALAVARGRVVYVGNDAGAAAYVGKRTRVIALHGRMVLPGFHDAHTHPMTGAMRLLRCQLGAFKTPPRLYAAIGKCAADRPGQGWILGAGWSPQMFGPGGPSRKALDALLPDRPAYLTTEDGYTGWVNSAALALAHIDAKSPIVDGLERDTKTGEPTGVLRNDAVNLVRAVIPRPSAAEYREALRRSTALANRFGITSMFDASTTPPVLAAYHAADLANELTVRIVAAQLVDPKQGPEQVDAMVAQRAAVQGRRFRADAAKLFLDGEVPFHTGALLAPYADTPGVSGDLFFPPDRLNAIVRRLDAEGFLIHMHAMGDRAVRAGLDAIAQAMAANGARDRRHQIAHVGVADPADIPRFGALGVTANLSPLWFPADDAVAAQTEAALGPKRSRFLMPMGAIAAAGGRIVASSDWPGPSMNPLEGVQYAMTRAPLDGHLPPRQPEQRISLAQAIAAYTRDAAWVVHEDKTDGTLAPGMAADLVVLDRDLFTLKPRDIHKARVLFTLLDGEPVWRDPRFAWR